MVEHEISRREGYFSSRLSAFCEAAFSLLRKVNYLAHIYLSGNNEEIMIGNFIADHLKGKDRFRFDGDILKGIQLHHRIDAFTDSHPVVELSKNRLRTHLRKYTPVAVDVIYDHFLARNWNNFHEVALPDYADTFYNLLIKNHELLPERTQQVFKYMSQQNWLVGYADFDHLQRIFNGMSRRTDFENNMQHSVELMQQDYLLYKKEFEDFFVELKEMSSNFLLELNA